MLAALGTADTPAKAYPRLVRDDLRELTGRPVTLTSLACSGLNASQLASSRPNLLTRAVRLDPDVVTVQVGANDIVLKCLPAKAIFKVRHTIPYAAKFVPERYEACKRHIARGFVAVEASLPRIFTRLKNETTAQVFVGTYYSGTGSEAESDVARRLNALIARTAASFGPRFHLVSGIAAAFRAHDCRAPRAERWLLGWDLCLHPNRAGQRALADRFKAAMKPFAAQF